MRLNIQQFKCEGCGEVFDSHELHQHVGASFCPDCGSEKVGWHQDRPARWFSVALYDISREYGGPEEGGWWYDHGQIVRGYTREFLDVESASEYFTSLKELQGEFPHTRPRVWMERAAPAQFPEDRPYYS